MRLWITGHNHSAERPPLAFRHQLCTTWICQYIETNSRECAAFTLILAQNVVVGLVLEFVWLEGAIWRRRNLIALSWSLSRLIPIQTRCRWSGIKQ